MRPAIFLDRDGVIIENRTDYVKSWDEVRLIPAAIQALRQMALSSFAVVVVTNQAVVGKGLITLTQADEINSRVIDAIRAHGGRIDAAYLCPHRADENCECRKPRPGMLLQAARDHHLDLSRSVMIGDAITDMQAARSAGVRSILVRTGRGAAELASCTQLAWFDIADDLTAAFRVLHTHTIVI
jgi:D-glycero-D-manno-heptose 1,7-bisphosphate phosphatase